MSAWKPAAVRPSCRYLRSKFSQRGDDAASGRITHARLPPAAPVPEEDGVPAPEQPASMTAAAPVRAATARMERFFISCLSSLNCSPQKGVATLLVGDPRARRPLSSSLERNAL